MLFRVFIALILLSNFSLAQEFNYTDSIKKLNSITIDSVYKSLTGLIANTYVKEKKSEDCKLFLLNQMELKKDEPSKFQHAFFLLCRVYYQAKEYESSLSLLDSALKSIEQFLPDVLAKLYRLKGQNYFRIQDFANAIESYKQSLKVLKENNDQEQMDDVLAGVSTSYSEMDNLPDALNYAQQAEVISKKTNDLESRSRILNTLGNINKTLGNLDEAIKNYRDCFEVASQTGDKEGMVLSTSSRAMIELDKKNYKSSWDILQYALKYARELDNKHLISGIKMNMANVRLEEGNASAAMELYLESVAIANEINDRRNIGLINANIGFLLTEEKKYKESNKYLEIALPYANELGDIALLKEIAGGFYDNYKALNLLKEALHYRELFTSYSDSLLNDDKAREISNLKTTYAVDEKERELNAKAEREKITTDAEIKREKLMRNFSIAGGALFLILAGFIFQRYRERHRTTLILSEKNKTIEKAYNDLKETQEELVETEKQREAQSIRVRIARDIHDDIGSGLTKITMLSDVVRKKIQQADIAESLSKITSFSKGVSASLSEIVWAINPNHDNISSLIGYMKSTSSNLLEDSSINYKLDFPEWKITTRIHPEIKRNIYLVMKEAINNALKYSEAKNIKVEFSVENNNFKLHIIDDGKGFDSSSNGDTGNGLRNMTSRMEQHNNTLQIISSQGNGCKIIAEGKLA